MPAILQSMRSGSGTQHPQEIVNFFASLATIIGGVESVEGGDFEVKAKVSPEMKVDVSMGRALIPTSDRKMAYPVRLYSADYEVTIASNGSGNPRKDAIVVYIDVSASPNAPIDNVAKITRVAGTPNASPSAPSDSDIQTAIGASNPFIRLANITVASGETEITLSEIEDTRRMVYIKSHTPLNPIAYTASFTPSNLQGNQQSMTLSGNVTVNTPTDMNAGDWLYLEFVQDGTGGRTITFSVTGGLWLTADTTPNTGAGKISAYALQKTATGFNMYLVGKEYA